MQGVGVDWAALIVYATYQRAPFAGVTGYASLRTAMLKVVASLGLAGDDINSPIYRAVENAWAAVNVGQPTDTTPPTVTASTHQRSPTALDITVDVDDPSGLKSGDVWVSSPLLGSALSLGPCTSHCVFTIDPSTIGSSDQNQVNVRAVDTRANTRNFGQAFSTDVTPPTLTITNDFGDFWPDTATHQSWTLNASDPSDVASASARIDGVPFFWGPWTRTSNAIEGANMTLDLSQYAQGAHTVRFDAKDTIGNATSQSHDFFVDTRPPEVCSLSVTLDPTVYGQLRVRLIGQDDGTGLSELRVFDEFLGYAMADFTRYPAGVAQTFIDDQLRRPGTYRFRGTCIDQRGQTVQTDWQSATIVPECGHPAAAGGPAVDVRGWEMGATTGTVVLRYQTFVIHDRIRVFAGTTLVADTGCDVTGGDTQYKSIRFSFNEPSRQLTVRVDPNCNPLTASPTTQWNYTISCP